MISVSFGTQVAEKCFMDIIFSLYKCKKRRLSKRL